MTQFAKKLQVGAAAALAFLGAENLTEKGGNTAEAAVILDTITDNQFNSLTTPGALNTSSGFGPNSGLIDATVGITFLGDGKPIDSLDVIWQYANSSSGVNTGNFQQFDWQVSLFLDSSKFTTEGALGRAGAVAPDFSFVFSDPSNSDYFTPIGSAGVADNHKASFDLADLDWATILGQEHVLTVTPVTTLGGDGTFGALALSPFLDGPIDLYDGATDNGAGAQRFSDLTFSQDRVAARIETTATVPEPSSLTIGLVAGSITLLARGMWRRRKED